MGEMNAWNCPDARQYVDKLLAGATATKSHPGFPNNRLKSVGLNFTSIFDGAATPSSSIGLWIGRYIFCRIAPFTPALVMRSSAEVFETRMTA